MIAPLTAPGSCGECWPLLQRPWPGRGVSLRGDGPFLVRQLASANTPMTDGKGGAGPSLDGGGRGVGSVVRLSVGQKVQGIAVGGAAVECEHPYDERSQGSRPSLDSGGRGVNSGTMPTPPLRVVGPSGKKVQGIAVGGGASIVYFQAANPSCTSFLLSRPSGLSTLASDMDDPSFTSFFHRPFPALMTLSPDMRRPP